MQRTEERAAKLGLKIPGILKGKSFLGSTLLSEVEDEDEAADLWSEIGVSPAALRTSIALCDGYLG